jgi:hypothetical protein
MTNPKQSQNEDGSSEEVKKEQKDADKTDPIGGEANTSSHGTGGSETAAEVLVGGCLSLKAAGHIVLDATGNKHKITEKLGDFLTLAQRRIFQKDVQDRVKAAGCQIDIAKIPNGETDTLQDVQLAIKRNSAQILK